ncbi:hypothetical protein E2562_005997 [Oryza meyeriana var. granulata]|uniref:DUF4220 domain-containing protein n=1 Tax=Oryza meyeriana var. granulata TaxID=110450 RepID=A0A6G1EVA4_9ORYZ|nr:hypothetical protein E2562_005997 [Oryza meyeriana var. granulata]
MHLGGQDTITAFAIEDNNLWLRHLLNLGVQVALALYVFWKSADRHSLHIPISGIFVFVTGIIKYAETALSLMYGELKNIHGSTGNEDKAKRQASENSLQDIPCTRWKRDIGSISDIDGRNKGDILDSARSQLKKVLNLFDEPTMSIKTLEEIRDMWTMLLI